MRNPRVFGFVVLTRLLALLSAASAGDAVRTWEMVEIELTADGPALENPYVGGLPDDGKRYVTAQFRGTGGEAEGHGMSLAGFWDGGRNWKIRFAPPLPGEWTYRTESRDPGLDGREGRISCRPWSEEEKAENPARRGFVRVAGEGPRAGRYFEYADGTPFFWVGDTWWNWTKRGIRFETFQRLADDRAEKGFNVGQLFFAGNGWGRPSSLLDATHRHPDLAHIRDIERMIAYANARGITVWIHAWWARPEMGEQIGEENIRRWWRYVVHRLGAYNVFWVIGGEYNMHDYGGLGLDFWKDIGRLIDREDPYERLLGAHPTPPGWSGGADAPQWSTAEILHDEAWLDHNQSQTGHGRWRNELTPMIIADAYAREPAKPVVVTEPWYEFVEGNPTAADIRFGAWSAVLSGAAGHSYGGGHVWRAHVPESPAGRGAWPLEVAFDRDTLDYAGARAMAYLGRFFRDIAWWRLEPHPELLSENPSPYCASVPGEEYVVFLRYGGVVKVDLRPSSPEDEFEYRWIDLVEERQRRTGTVAGGAVRTFHPPEDYPGVLEFKDWVLHIRKPVGAAGT